MKKTLYLVAIFTVTIALTVILRSFFPKYQGILLFIACILIADSLLWITMGRWLAKRKYVIRILLSCIFWLPFTLLVTLVIIGFSYPFTDWPIPIRSYLLSSLIIIVVVKLFPILFLPIEWFVRRILSAVLHIRMRRIEKTRRSGDLAIRHRKMPNPGTPGLWAARIRVTGWLAGAFMGLLMLSGILFWVFSFKVYDLDFSSSKIPKTFDNFRIVQVSDIHLGGWTRKAKLDEAVKEINSLKPDLIVFTGDMFTFSTSEGKDFMDILRKLHSPLGIMAILGNHDYGDYVRWKNLGAKALNFKKLHDFYSELGWDLLLNCSETIHRGADSIFILGVENWGAARRFQKYGDIEKALQGVNSTGFSILLSHDPSYWDRVVSKTHPEIALTLSGHTHGGQFGIEAGPLRWSILSMSNPLWGGLYTRRSGNIESSLYVNRGLGTVGYAGRVGIRPEITLIILHHRN
jgi:hypothetical protein